jgi:glycine/D-amino acid oxidase-like deaminating enzyme
MATTWDAVVIGGGFYGLYLAEYLAASLRRVVLCERQAELMQRASYANQARVHNGYHYPRSILTAVRSRVNFPRFVEEFRPAIDDTFRMVYAIGREFSKVTAQQFYRSMRRVEAAIQPAPKSIGSLFDSTYVEAVFLTREYAFDSRRLCQLMTERVRRAGVEVRLETEVRSVRPTHQDQVEVEVAGPNGSEVFLAKQVFCCGYAQLNGPGVAGGLPVVPLKHELAEIALVEVPDALQGLGITVMDGPFFSLMPFPARGLHSLSHVRYTPHAHWYDAPDQTYRSAYERLSQSPKQSAFPFMRRDAARFLPAVADCLHRDSLWEVKTVLPRSETDDSRPILFKPHFGFPNYHLVMGGKIDNIYDITEVIGQTCGWG